MAIEGQDQNLPADDTGRTDSTSGSKTDGQQPQDKQAQKPEAKVDAGNPDRRDAGLLADLQKERRARQAYEKRIAELEASHAASEKRVRALAGVEPKSDEEAEAETIKAQFTKMFPALARLDNEELVEAINGLLQQSQSKSDIEAQYWQDRAQQMVGGVIEAVEKEFGELTPRQQQKVKQAYGMRAHEDPEFLARHERGDKTLIAEFAAEYIEDTYEPARKRQQQKEAERFRPVPGGRDRTVAGSKPKSIDWKNQKSVEDAMVDSYRNHGGGFKD